MKKLSMGQIKFYVESPGINTGDTFRSGTFLPFIRSINDVKIDFDLGYLAFEKVDNITDYYPDFGIPKLTNNLDQRINKIKKSKFKGKKNKTRAGNGFTGEELFELQKELRLLVHKNLNKAPSKRELEIIKLLAIGKPDKKISLEDTRKALKKKIDKKTGKLNLFYDGYSVYDDIRKYRTTGDLRYLERAMVKADYIMTDHGGGRNIDEQVDFIVENNGTLGIGRGFSGVCEAIIEIVKTPELHNKKAPSLDGSDKTYMEKANEWMPFVIELIDKFNIKSKYKNGRWTEGDGKSINRFLYYTHLVLAASEAAKAMNKPGYAEWSQEKHKMVNDICTFFQGDCLLTPETIAPARRVSMTWDKKKKVFTSKDGPFVIWSYAWGGDLPEDCNHMQMDMEAVDSILELDNSLLREDFKKMVTTMLFICTFNTETGGMIGRRLGPYLPGQHPTAFKPWHAHYAPMYGRYIGKFGSDEIYKKFMDYNLLVWDDQLIKGKLGRFTQYPMPCEVVEARLFKYNTKAPFPRGSRH